MAAHRVWLLLVVVAFASRETSALTVVANEDDEEMNEAHALSLISVHSSVEASEVKIDVVDDSTVSHTPSKKKIAEAEKKVKKEMHKKAHHWSHYLVPKYLVPKEPRYGQIAYDIKYKGYLQEIETLPMRRPKFFNVAVATLKTWSADLVVQTVESKTKFGRPSVDWRRSLAFAAFGLLYIGLAQWGLYVSVMTSFFPEAIEFANEPFRAKIHNVPGQEDLLMQVILDNFVFAVVFYFPAFYILKECVHTGWRPTAPLNALRKYRQTLLTDNMISMCFWVPGDLVVFAAPMYMRLPLDHFFSFSWTMLLSYNRGASTTDKSETSGKASDCTDVSGKA